MNSRRYTIAIIDDDCDDRAFIMAAFRKAHATINFIEAIDGQDFVENLAEYGPIDLILCDLSMPRMNGLELLIKLKGTEYRNVPLIIFSTSSLEIDKSSAIGKGAAEFVTKPSQIREYDELAGKLIGILQFTV